MGKVTIVKIICLACVVPVVFINSLGEESAILADDNSSSSKVSSLLTFHIKQKTDYLAQNKHVLHSKMPLPGMESQDHTYTTDVNQERVFLHFAQQPTSTQLSELSSLGVTSYPDSWIPPVGRHPTGFVLADMPVDKLDALAARSYVVKINTAEQILTSQLDTARLAVGVNDVWSSGHKGAGVTVAVLDSGIDTSNVDLPDLNASNSKNYSNYPILDDDIDNPFSGHGTHVAGCLLGRGTNSGGVYQGIAPEANLVFLKTGRDDERGTYSVYAASVAIRDAVDKYHAQIINLSFGGWSPYHDGTAETSQAVDYAVSRGATVFAGAGNDADEGCHYSGRVAGHSSTLGIKITLKKGTYKLPMNLVWYDGFGTHNDLVLQYLDSNHNLLPSSMYLGGESPRGTESRISQLNNAVGPGSYYLQVTNNSTSDQFFHLYELNKDSSMVVFSDPDPNYTIISPADADNAIAVGAYVTRENWTNYAGLPHTFGETLNSITTYSARGPRVDGEAPGKPNIVAPGSAIISVRDKIYTWPNINPNIGTGTGSYQLHIIDNDGKDLNGSGPADYLANEGTSMASPVAAGVAALMLSAMPSLTPSQIRYVLEHTATDKGDAGFDNIYGWGLINASAAINSVSSVPNPISPANGSTVYTLSPRLAWNPPVGGATSYGLQVSTNPTFTSLVVDVSGITEAYRDMAANTLHWGTTYYWRVNATNISGPSAWSEIWSFKPQQVAALGIPWSWGDDVYGQLGNGTTTNSGIPVQVDNVSGITSIAAGGYHNLALNPDGTVWAWGDNTYGQLGIGTYNHSPIPVQVSGLSGVTAISAGEYHSLALKSDGTVWAWGYNYDGQLGNGNTSGKNSPVQALNLSGVTAIAAGEYHNLAVKSDGTVWAWGYNYYGQLGNGNTSSQSAPIQVSNLTGVTAIAGGGYHSLALKSGGTIWAWGDNYNGQLGNGTTTHSSTPVQISSLKGVAAVAAGGYHSLAIKADGTVWAWGYNYDGELGNGTTTDSSTPVQLSNLSGVTVICAGEYDSLAVKSDFTVWAWGWNQYGQLGNGTTANSYTPTQVVGLDGVVAIAAGSSHSLALKTDGTVWAWGDNINGDLGNGSSSGLAAPVQVNSLSGITAVVTRLNHSLALRSDGTVWAWGLNDYGQLGKGTPGNSSTPVQGSSLIGVAAVAAGGYHSLALKSDGAVWGWGRNDKGQLGNESTNGSDTPVRVGKLSGVIAIAAGNYHSLALKPDGTVWAWGRNNNGQLGDGTTTSSSTPIGVTNLTGIATIAAGGDHSLALKSDGTVWAWGRNSNGQLGNGTTANSSIPVQVCNLSGVKAIAASYFHSLALKSDGTVWAWGGNYNGQLGNGTTTSSSIPVQVSNLSGVTAIAAGGNHSLALKSDGTVWAWGYNYSGQLGNGTTTTNSIPVQVSNLSRVSAVAAGSNHSLALVTRLEGDVNNDGKINSVDALKIAQHLVAIITLTGDDLVAADVDGSGGINSIDLLKVKQYLVGIINSFPRGTYIP